LLQEIRRARLRAAAGDGGIIMRKVLIVAAIFAAICTATSAHAMGERTVTGVAIGAGVGALIAGPVGAVAGGVMGGFVGGPKFSRTSGKRCWYDRAGYRHCGYF
jgi:hypothetical protein